MRLCVRCTAGPGAYTGGAGRAAAAGRELPGGAGEVLRRSADQLAQTLPGDPEAARETAELEDLACALEEEWFVAEDIKYMKQRPYDAMRSKGLAAERYRRG